MTKGEIAHDEQFLLWPQGFQLYFTIKLSFMETFQVFVTIITKSFAEDLLYVGKGYITAVSAHNVIFLPLTLQYSTQHSSQATGYFLHLEFEYIYNDINYRYKNNILSIEGRVNIFQISQISSLARPLDFCI